MGQFAAIITDAVDIRAYNCIIPDVLTVKAAAARLAEYVGYPATTHDGSKINYGMVVKGGSLLDSDSLISDIEHSDDITIRIVPELTAGSSVLSGNEPASEDGNQEETDNPHDLTDDIIVGEPHALRHDDLLDLKPDVRIDADVHRSISAIADKDRYLEVGGLLLGEVRAEGKKRIIEITAFIPALSAENTRTHVKFTHEAWADILKSRDAQYSELVILGWYHSHAGWGVFLSDSDVFIHSYFYPHPNMVAYVVDSTLAKDAFFCWYQGKLAASSTYAIVSAPPVLPRRPERRKAYKPGSKDIIIALLAIIALYMALINPKPEMIRPAPAPPTKKVVHQPIKQAEIETYTIGPKDNLWLICNRRYKDGELADALAEYNGITDQSGLQIGQKIKLPPAEVLRNIDRR